MFKVGDKVKWAGVEGVVIGTGVADETYRIWVSFKNGEEGRFTRDGKLLDWHKEPSLVLVERDANFEEVVGYSPVCKSFSSNDVVTIPAIIVTAPAIYTTKDEALEHNAYVIGYQEVKYFRKVE